MEYTKKTTGVISLSVYEQILTGLDDLPVEQDNAVRRVWIERLALTAFRNYQEVSLDLDMRPVVLTGSNGAGKTNLLEAVSLFAPGRGLRRAAFADLLCFSADLPWAISAQISTPHGCISVGTGPNPQAVDSERSGRLVRIDGEPVKGAGVLSEYFHVSWLTPAMDGLFTGPASERRRFLDRLIVSFDPEYRKRINHFERAMRQRNRLLDMGDLRTSLFDGLEMQMAEVGVAIAAARLEAVEQLSVTIARGREQASLSHFPWASLAVEGTLEKLLDSMAAVEVEDEYRQLLVDGRERDRAARRTLEGPHRSDLIVAHGPKDMQARHCSTGEQKALLVRLILAHAELAKHMHDGYAPILLLDEIAAHLDEIRRAALIEEILRLNVQAWMTGTEREMFAAFGERAHFFTVEKGCILAV